MANPLSEDLTDRHVVLAEETMAPQYKDIQFRVFLCRGGFGCAPYTGGRAVFGTTPIDGEEFRINSSEIERFATDEEIALVTKKEDADAKE